MANILIVDDSPTDQKELSSILEKNGHSVTCAADGENGVKMATSNQPDLILMDVVMPGLNGFQATRHITKTEGTQHIPVIILSSKDQETDKLWAERQGASGYIIKPASEKELMTAINKLL